MVKTDVKFLYDGSWRRVSNPTWEWNTGTLIGFEMRKGGKFSYRTKRYSIDKMNVISFIETMLRSGPKVGIPAS